MQKIQNGYRKKENAIKKKEVERRDELSSTRENIDAPDHNNYSMCRLDIDGNIS